MKIIPIQTLVFDRTNEPLGLGGGASSLAPPNDDQSRHPGQPILIIRCSAKNLNWPRLADLGTSQVEYCAEPKFWQSEVQATGLPLEQACCDTLGSA